MAIREGAGRAGGTDPRLGAEFTRTINSTDAAAETVHLVGVVHDHPASAYRARKTVELHNPDVLALEVAPVALPFFESAATDGPDSETFGGEFSAAVRAATDARVVGIDGPNSRFVRMLARRCLVDRPSAATVARLLRGTVSATRGALGCRLAGAVNAYTPWTVRVGDFVEHDCDRTDDPATQAADETRQVARVENVLDLFERPPTVRLRDEIREACMVQELDALRQEGSVVAVLGAGHIDAVAAALRERDATDAL